MATTARLSHRSTDVPKSIFGLTTAVGLSYCAFAERIVARRSAPLDFVEIPFEQLVSTPAAIRLRDKIPLLLHCASLSLAGNAQPAAALVERLAQCIEETRTPWLSEHLAYVRADGRWRDIAEHQALLGDADGDGAVTPPFNVGYTVSPQLSPPILERVRDNTLSWRQHLGLPIILENGPIYFQMPGSTMSQSSFISELCASSDKIFLLLDLAHLAITCGNLQLDPYAVLGSLPLHRVVEIHLSGISRQSDLTWDDHSNGAPPIVFELLRYFLCRQRPRAITLEYNWDDDFPVDVLLRDVGRVRDLLATQPHQAQ
jgi:uncharacterized protein